MPFLRHDCYESLVSCFVFLNFIFSEMFCNSNVSEYVIHITLTENIYSHII